VYERSGDTMQKAQFTDVRILALDPRLDLALLKIESPDKRPFVAAPVGDSLGIEGGETVFAIGSPLGLERTVSQGIVSLKNRPLGGQLYIQTTTQINPGNSGGPLFNLRGEVVGVNNMKAMMVGVEGVNFAIPSATLKNFLRNRDAFAFDTRHPNAGFRYLEPPRPVREAKPAE
jgi:serine protease Do